jgi:hypothetical protein
MSRYERDIDIIFTEPEYITSLEIMPFIKVGHNRNTKSCDITLYDQNDNIVKTFNYVGNTTKDVFEFDPPLIVSDSIYSIVDTLEIISNVGNIPLSFDLKNGKMKGTLLAPTSHLTLNSKFPLTVTISKLKGDV